MTTARTIRFASWIRYAFLLTAFSGLWSCASSSKSKSLEQRLNDSSSDWIEVAPRISGTPIAVNIFLRGWTESVKIDCNDQAVEHFGWVFQCRDKLVGVAGSQVATSESTSLKLCSNVVGSFVFASGVRMPFRFQLRRYPDGLRAQVCDVDWSPSHLDRYMVWEVFEELEKGLKTQTIDSTFRLKAQSMPKPVKAILHHTGWNHPLTLHCNGRQIGYQGLSLKCTKDDVWVRVPAQKVDEYEMNEPNAEYLLIDSQNDERYPVGCSNWTGYFVDAEGNISAFRYLVRTFSPDKRVRTTMCEKLERHDSSGWLRSSWEPAPSYYY